MTLLKLQYQNKFFQSNKKFFEKFPKKKTVSEYTCTLRYVKPRVFNKTYVVEISFISLLKLTLILKDLILEYIK